MVSRLRMKLDLLLQGILLAILALAASLEPWRTGGVVVLLILTFIQIVGAAQLWWWHHYRPAKTYLWLFLGATLSLAIALYFCDLRAWYCLIVLTLAYFSHTIYMATVVLRRPRSFWDIT